MKFEKRQVVEFDLAPTGDPDATIGHARTVVNPDHGMGIDVLMKVIKQQIPIAKNPQTQTLKRIIRVTRYECPCCNTDITALVAVGLQGLVTDEWDEIKGLYRVEIFPDHGDCRVVVDKLSGTTIYDGRTPLLPRKDYAADKAARKEIEDRNEMFADLARKNPGRVLRVTGVETAQDLSNLVQVTSQIVQAEPEK